MPSGIFNCIGYSQQIEMYAKSLKTLFHDAWKSISYPYAILNLGLMEECAWRAPLP